MIFFDANYSGLQLLILFYIWKFLNEKVKKNILFFSHILERIWPIYLSYLLIMKIAFYYFQPFQIDFIQPYFEFYNNINRFTLKIFIRYIFK